VSEPTTKHTPEPWRSEINTDGEAYVQDERGCTLATVHGRGTLQGKILDIREDNARRICAALNACAGISTEALEAGVVAELVEALKRFIEEMLTWNSTMGPYERLRGEVCPDLEALYARVKP
jgi:hypothetical protein